MTRTTITDELADAYADLGVAQAALVDAVASGVGVREAFAAQAQASAAVDAMTAGIHFAELPGAQLTTIRVAAMWAALRCPLPLVEQARRDLAGAFGAHFTQERAGKGRDGDVLHVRYLAASFVHQAALVGPAQAGGVPA